METVLSYISKGFIFLAFVSSALMGQTPFQTMATLDGKMKEISGIVKGRDNTFIAINDGGNSNEVHLLNAQGEVIKTVNVTNAVNKDWEAIAKDQEGHIYLGDIGNNENKRKDLSIYKVRESEVYSKTEVTAEVISFQYEDQQEFPPPVAAKTFDAEAMIVRYNRIYIFTKNRTNPFTGYTYQYRIPNATGNQIAIKTDSLFMGEVASESWITDAAFSADLRHLILLSHNKVWLISDFYRDHFLKGFVQEIPLNHFSQKESVSFMNDTTLVIADETLLLNKGKLYHLDITKNIALIDSLRKKEVILPTKVFEDSLKVELNTVVGGDVFFEIFDQNMNRVDFARIGYFDPGQNTFWIKPKKVMNASYMLNVRVGNRPHGFFVRRFKEVDWDELYRIRDSIQGR